LRATEHANRFFSTKPSGMTEQRNWSAIIRQGVAAGIAGGILMEAYLLLTTVVPAHGSVLQVWQWIASAAIGDVAFSNVAYAWFGLLLHFLVSIGWATGYAYLAQERPYMNQRWAISGPVYGFVVYIMMDILLLGVRKFIPPPTPLLLLNALVAHSVFFGLPVAFVVARLDASAMRSPSTR
jgi:uncharacterized membrane protein YagU involved in acid resistance